MHPFASHIAFEVLGAASLKLSQGFSRLAPSLVIMVGYGAPFYWPAL